MKKTLIAAASALSLLAPASALACMDHTMTNWEMDPAATNVTAETKMSLRMNKMVDARARMDVKATGVAHPMYYLGGGRPDRRAVRSETSYTNRTNRKKHSSVKGYNPLVESEAEAK